jgi:hypothetical protein
MDNQSIRDSIQESRDSVGVITNSSLTDEARDFTPADWRQAAAMYGPKPGQTSGFFITDDKNGAVQIHNDLTEAKTVANSTIPQLVGKDAGVAMAMVAGGAVMWASTSAIAAEGTAAIEGAATSTALVAAGAAVAPALLAGAAIAGTLTVGYEGAHILIEQATARDDVAHNLLVSIQK